MDSKQTPNSAAGLFFIPAAAIVVSAAPLNLSPEQHNLDGSHILIFHL